MKKVDLFIDSGAFTAWSKGIDVSIDAYIQFIRDYSKYITQYSVLDVIGDAEGTLKNQKYMEDAGLNPLPCFHFGEPWKYLEHYVDNYDYITLGGMVRRPPKDLIVFLNNAFDIICDKDGVPKCKVHGFGINSLKLLKQYPWHSVDASSWAKMARYGMIPVPPRAPDGSWDFLEEKTNRKTQIVGVSSITKRKKMDIHFDAMSKERQADVLAWIEQHGFCMGTSSFRDVEKGYKPQEHEKFVPKSKTRLEVFEEYGASNIYQIRDRLTVMYMSQLQAALSEVPLVWKRPATQGLLPIKGISKAVKGRNQ